MPPTDEPPNEKSLEQLVAELDLYPLEAFHFIQQGLGYSVEKFHAGLTDPAVRRHISGRELCEGLHEYALMKWGLMARTVLRRWNINSTLDFGRIVFAMVDNGFLKKTDEDSLEDFRDVYDFKSAFESSYRIPPEHVEKTTEGRS
jgi:uncharacterized repeat protein (TIGR04138 family)